VNASVLYVGERDDLDFSTFPATRVTLADYGVANLAGSWRIDERFEVFGRVENLFDTEYEEIEGFGVAGAAVYIGGSASF
jgi:vitamin B12 transporter